MKGISRVDIGVLILRLGLGLTLTFFGAQKMFGVFGGMGYMPTVDMFHSKMGIPIVLSHLAIYGELLGGLGVLFGLLTPIASLGILSVMAVATTINMKAPGALNGIFLGTQGSDPSKLFFPGSLGLAAFGLMIIGPGKISLDAKLFRQSKR
jgi:putative oxidoreductase